MTDRFKDIMSSLKINGNDTIGEEILDKARKYDRLIPHNLLVGRFMNSRSVMAIYLSCKVNNVTVDLQNVLLLCDGMKETDFLKYFKTIKSTLNLTWKTLSFDNDYLSVTFGKQVCEDAKILFESYLMNQSPEFQNTINQEPVYKCAAIFIILQRTQNAHSANIHKKRLAHLGESSETVFMGKVNDLIAFNKNKNNKSSTKELTTKSKQVISVANRSNTVTSGVKILSPNTRRVMALKNKSISVCSGKTLATPSINSSLEIEKLRLDREKSSFSNSNIGFTSDTDESLYWPKEKRSKISHNNVSSCNSNSNAIPEVSNIQPLFTLPQTTHHAAQPPPHQQQQQQVQQGQQQHPLIQRQITTNKHLNALKIDRNTLSTAPQVIAQRVQSHRELKERKRKAYEIWKLDILSRHNKLQHNSEITTGNIGVDTSG